MPASAAIGRTLSEAKQAEMAATYHGLNPVLLLSQINSGLEQLWRLAERSASSVTGIMKQQGGLR